MRNGIKERIGAVVASAALFGGSLGLTLGAVSPAQAVTTNANVTCEGDASTLSTGLNLYKQRLDLVAESDARFGSAVELVYVGPKFQSVPVSDGSWKVAHNDRLGYAPDAKAPEVFEEAKIAGWTDLQNPEAQWISGWAPFGESQVQDSQGSDAQTSFFYKLAFNLEEPSIATLGKLTMHYAADDKVTGVWINGREVFDDAAGRGERGSITEVDIDSGLRGDANEITVRVQSAPTTQSFKAWFTVSPKDPSVKVADGQLKDYLCPQPVKPKIACDGSVSQLATGLLPNGEVARLTAEEDSRFGHSNKLDSRWEISDGFGLSAVKIGQGYFSKPGTYAASEDLLWRPADIAGWMTLPKDAKAQWLSGSPEFTGSQFQGLGDPETHQFLYRLKFDVESAAIAAQMKLIMNYAVDDAVTGLWINGVPVADLPKQDPVAADHRKNREAYERVEINYGLKQGENELMVEVSSRPHTQGFNAYFESAPKDPNVKLEAGQEESYYCPQPVQQEINCDSAASVFDTGHAKSSPVRKYVRKDDAETMKFDINSVSRNWVVAGGADQIHGYVAAVGDQAPADAVYSPAVVAGWLTEGEGAEFIAASAPYQRNDLANQFVQPDRDIRSFYYKTEFELTDEQAAKNLKLVPTFEADDYIAAVWVNGVRVFYNTELQKYMASDTYVKRNDEPRIAKPFDVEFTAEARKMPQMELSGFVKGKNTIEVQVASHSNAEKVKMTFAYAPSVAAQGGLCPQSPTQPRKDKADRPTLLPKTGTDSTQAAVLAALTLSAAAAIALRGRKQR